LTGVIRPVTPSSTSSIFGAIGVVIIGYDAAMASRMDIDILSRKEELTIISNDAGSPGNAHAQSGLIRVSMLLIDEDLNAIIC